jgi:hypothetical protein
VEQVKSGTKEKGDRGEKKNKKEIETRWKVGQNRDWNEVESWLFLLLGILTKQS